MERTKFKINTTSNREKWMLLEIFNTKGFLAINKTAIKELGFISAGLLGNYIEKYKYFLQNHPDSNGWFFLTHEDIMNELNLGESLIRSNKQELIKKGILITERRGVPAKEWITIDIEALGLVLRFTEVLPSNSRRSITNNKNTKNKKEYSSDDKINLEMFHKFWNLYPRKVDKGKALSKWRMICNKKDKPTWIEIKRAIIHQMKSERWQDPTFIPHPTTWLNQNRWLDDPEEMKVTKFKDNKQKFIYDDGIKYVLGDDGRYYHSRTKALYIP